MGFNSASILNYRSLGAKISALTRRGAGLWGIIIVVIFDGGGQQSGNSPRRPKVHGDILEETSTRSPLRSASLSNRGIIQSSDDDDPLFRVTGWHGAALARIMRDSLARESQHATENYSSPLQFHVKCVEEIHENYNAKNDCQTKRYTGGIG